LESAPAIPAARDPRSRLGLMQYLDTPLKLVGLAGEDLAQWYEQAKGLSDLFEERERQTVSGFFMGIAAMAMFSAQGLLTGAEHESSLVTPTDFTAPDDHQRDDIGTLMAHVMAVMDKPETRPNVRETWRQVLVALMRNRDVLAGRLEGREGQK
jgi:hypothetical protein